MSLCLTVIREFPIYVHMDVHTYVLNLYLAVCMSASIWELAMSCSAQYRNCNCLTFRYPLEKIAHNCVLPIFLSLFLFIF